MIILSLPDSNALEAHHLHSTYAGHAHFPDWRLDYLQGLHELTPDLFDEATIVTVREKNEGGMQNLSFKQNIINSLVTSRGCYADIELSTYLFHKKSYAFIPREKLILSYHHKGKISWDYLEKVIAKMNEFRPAYAKLAVQIDTCQDLLKLRELAGKIQAKPLLIGMGKLGYLSRLFYAHLGSVGTYVCAPEYETACGQIDINAALSMRLQNVTSTTKVGGLLGSEQVFHSTGILYYNEYFEKHDIDARYFPFSVTNTLDFIDFIKEFAWYGLSVTMPYKRYLATLSGSSNNTINMLMPDNQTENTDMDAFVKSFEYLNLAKDDSILVYGSGGTAESALFALRDYKHVCIAARNSIDGAEMATRYSRDYVTRFRQYDMIINCTPIGMKAEDFFGATGYPHPAKFINLPYGIANNEQDYAFVDGSQFWCWQAERQLKVFLESIKKLDKNND